jgi:predicted nuclease of predicted toxin-antitoxin system
MRFLVDADLPRAVADALRGSGYEAVDVRDTYLGQSPDEDIAFLAKKERFCLITGDFGFADTRNYPPEDYDGIIVLGVPRHATARTIRKLVDRLLARPEVLALVPGRLAIVEPGRVRLRPS